MRRGSARTSNHTAANPAWKLTTIQQATEHDRTLGGLSTKETDHGCQQSSITQCRTGPTGVEQGQAPGPKPPLRLGHVWSIRARLQLERRTRDLALFNLAIDSKLRGCDLVALRVDDVAFNGYAVDRATVRQRKTGRPVRFELTDVTRQAVDDCLRESGLTSGQRPLPRALRP